MRRFLMALLLVMCGAARAAQADDVRMSGDVQKSRSVWAAYDAWLAAYAHGDLEPVMAMFDSACVVSYQGVKDQGFAELRAGYVQDFQTRTPGTTWAASVEEVYAGADLAFVRGVWELHPATTGGKAVPAIRNRSVDVLRLGADGRWRIFRSLTYPEKG